MAAFKHVLVNRVLAKQALVALALHPLAHQLAHTASRFGSFAGTTLGRLFIGPAILHLAEHAFALQLLLQDAKRLVNIVFTYSYVHGPSRLSVWLDFPAGHNPKMPRILALGRAITQADLP